MEKKYIATRGDVVSLYEEDRKTTIRFTKLTHTSVYLKPLQRQNVPLVRQVFNDKIIAAFKAIKGPLNVTREILFLNKVGYWLVQNDELRG